MARTIVGVLRGGASSEYPLSLKTGAAVLSALPEEKYDTRDILIDKRGFWHVRGVPNAPVRALSQVDVVLSALHGGVGEDGTVARVLERAGVPFAGSRAAASGLSLNKLRAREVLQKTGIRMPRAASFGAAPGLTTADMAQMVFSRFSAPYVVKPVSEGASHGIRFASTLLELPDAIGDVLDTYGQALVEEFIRGREASVAVIEDFRGEDLYALPPAEVIKPQGFTLVHPAHHEEGLLGHIVPSSFSYPEKQALMDAARAAHRALGLLHFSRADFILTPRAAYLLEVNAIPGLYPGASLPPMLEAVGSSVSQYLEHVIELSRNA